MNQKVVSELKPGDSHYTAYVGPPEEYDFMGATQFRLLTALGLGANHRLLDFGCGSLRAGRLFITYLDTGNYFGIEPNKWLVEDGISHHLGWDVVNVKKPTFAHIEDFSIPFDINFDFIVAQSIFSHTGLKKFEKSFRNFYSALDDHGIILATFVVGSSELIDEDWVYPGCVKYNRQTLDRVADKIGLHYKKLPWYHPRQTWYVFAKRRDALPRGNLRRYVNGAVLRDQRFVESWHPLRKFVARATRFARYQLPPRFKYWLKSTGLF